MATDVLRSTFPIWGLLLLLHVALVESCKDTMSPLPTSTTSRPTACPSPYESVWPYCYYLSPNVTTSWQEGRTFCQSYGGDLAVIHWCDDFRVLVLHIHVTGQEVPEGWSYWIGGSDLGDEGSWYWIDGRPMALGVPFWGEEDGKHEPSGGTDQNCARLSRDDRYYIHDGQCSEGAYPLCQYGVNTLDGAEGPSNDQSSAD